MTTVSPKEERALLAIAVLVGALAVTTLPLVLTLGSRVLGVSFAIPLALAAAGRLRGQRAIELGGGLGSLALLVLAVLLSSAPLALTVMALGTLTVVFAVGGLLGELDRGAARLWMAAAAIALVLGVALPLLADAAAGGGVLAVPVLAFGAVLALVRVRRGPRPRERRR